MGWRIPWRLCPNNAVFQCLIIGFALWQASPMDVRTPSELQAVNGSAITLGCTFISTHHITTRMSVDWSYRPQNGGPLDSFFYFYSEVHLPQHGQFKGRVQWIGRPAQGEASILLLNTTLKDNGTYTCTVKNPPDAHGVPGSIQLTVVPKQLSVRFSDVAVLMALVLLPSVIIAPVLLGRMCCLGRPCCSKQAKPKPKGQGLHSPIEVTEREELVNKKPGLKGQEKPLTCCEIYFQDSDCDDYYIHNDKLPEAAVAETPC
ncbi:hypothetical protein AAFF_G00345930 [Aldrovandia affinis]|uniref:Ig-like domain-containing protein n=1 Tax=Aldrovandia affinis TaxID=143900 RepID=A0AAD7WP02_9TELE|nr:hypothetical protein AAFF_G00345930 [Aldrovandia affinis]